MENYFSKFPTIQYNGKTVTDITRRVRIVDSFHRIPTAYYRYEITNGDRPDNIAYYLYEDPSLAWILYLSQNLTDPYYDWYLSEEQLNSLIIEKYGTYETAVNKIAFYRSNWTNDDTELSNSYYENHLEPTLKKYWSPVFGEETRVIAYKRNREDIVMNTNKIISLTVEDSSLASNGEIMDFKTDSNETVGRCEVLKLANSTTIMIQHVSGTVNTSVLGVGRESNTEIAISEVNTLIENISNDEAVYWESVSYFDVETERNEKNKIINLLQPEYTLSLAESLRQKLKE